MCGSKQLCSACAAPSFLQTQQQLSRVLTLWLQHKQAVFNALALMVLRALDSLHGLLAEGGPLFKVLGGAGTSRRTANYWWRHTPPGSLLATRPD